MKLKDKWVVNIMWERLPLLLRFKDNVSEDLTLNYNKIELEGARFCSVMWPALFMALS